MSVNQDLLIALPVSQKFSNIMSTHPSVTTYFIGGPPNGTAGVPTQDSRARDLPESRPISSHKHSKISRNEHITTPQMSAQGRDVMHAQSQPHRGRVYSNDGAPLQSRPSKDSYSRTILPSRTHDRALSPVPGTGLWSVIERLPQPADDRTIISLVQQVFFLADNFVDNHYGNHRGRTIGKDPRFMKTKFPFLDDGNSPADVLFLISEPTIAIKHCIIHLLLSCISFDDSNGQFPSLLPREFTVTASALSRPTNQMDSPENFAALSAHRVLLSYLRSDVFNDASYRAYLHGSMHNIGYAIEKTFAPWQETHSKEHTRRSALTALMEKTAQLGILLFSQSSTFEFAWWTKGASMGDLDIEIYPRLLKINDEQAKDLHPSLLMLNAKSVRTRYMEEIVLQDHLLRIEPIHESVEHHDSSSKLRSVNLNDTPRTNVGIGHTTYNAQMSLPASPTTDIPELSANLEVQQTKISKLSSSDYDLEDHPAHELSAHEGEMTNQFREYEGKAEKFVNGTLRSPTDIGSTRDAYLQQRQNRRKLSSRPPSASIQQFAENPSPARRRSSNRTRSSSASSEKRSRSESLFILPQRRASVSNDRTSRIRDYGDRVPSDANEFRSRNSQEDVLSSETTSCSTTGRALPTTQGMVSSDLPGAEVRRTMTSDQHSITSQPRNSSSALSSGLSDPTSRESKKSSIWKKLLGKK